MLPGSSTPLQPQCAPAQPGLHVPNFKGTQGGAEREQEVSGLFWSNENLSGAEELVSHLLNDQNCIHRHTTFSGKSIPP